jgi:hypothetical protein
VDELDVLQIKSMRFLLITFVVASIVCGCRHSPLGLPSLTFGDGDLMLKPLLDVTLAGQDTQFSEISWSGGGSSNEFAVDDSLIVKNASVGDIAAKLSAELDKLPDRRGWKSHGSGSGGDGSIQNYEISYEEGNARFYVNFILVQHEKDVDILILHKGVRR